MRNSFTGWLGCVVLVAGSAVAQIPTVPTDHYGPPVDCPVRNGLSVKTANPQSLATAMREQRLGESQSWEGATVTLAADEPVDNIAFARARVAAYADCVGESGCYWADLDAQYRRAESALRSAVKVAKKGEKLAAVMDIDETVLSGYCESKREDFGFISPMFQDWIVSEEAAVAIPGAQRFYALAKSLGVAIFFITGRPGMPDSSAGKHDKDQTEATARNLRAAGFEGWAGLALRNGSENAMSTIAYKSGERQRVLDKGYRIVVSVGDQWSDLEGEPLAQISVKLPNPFYFLP